MYTSASAIGSTSSVSIPAGAWLTPWTETVVVVPEGGAVGSASDAAAPPAAAAPRTLSWNLAWAFFFLRRSHQKYTPRSTRTRPSPARYTGSENSSMRLGSGGGGAFFAGGFGAAVGGG